MSRLQGHALRLAHAKAITRLDPHTLVPNTCKGIETLVLSGVEATVDPHPDALISPEQPSGLHQCLDDLRRDFEVEDQDPAWISNELMNDCIDRFFMFERSHEEYVCPIVFNGIAASEKPKITVVSGCLSQ
jgi:hypothetical protein